jgi:hypothetical protein
LEQLKQNKMGMKFGTWNFRSLCVLGSLKMVSRQSAKYKLDLVGIQDVRSDKVEGTCSRH